MTTATLCRFNAGRTIQDDWGDLLEGKVSNWSEEAYAAYLARKEQNYTCADLGKQNTQNGQQNQRQAPRNRSGFMRRGRTEHEEQCLLIKACAANLGKYPELELLHAVPNGGARHVAVAKKLKAEGVKAGVPDLFLPVPRGPFHGLYIELKARGGTVSDNQRRMLCALEKQGYGCVVAYGWEPAWREIEGYLKTKKVTPLSEAWGWAR